MTDDERTATMTTAVEKARLAIRQRGTARQILKDLDPASKSPRLTIRTIRKARQGRLPALERLAAAKFLDDAKAGA